MSPKQTFNWFLYTNPSYSLLHLRHSGHSLRVTHGSHLVSHPTSNLSANVVNLAFVICCDVTTSHSPWYYPCPATMIFHQENCNNFLICFSSLSLHKANYITPLLWTFQWLLIIENPEIHRRSCDACSAASGLHFSPWASLFMPMFTVFLPTWLHFCFLHSGMHLPRGTCLPS